MVRHLRIQYTQTPSITRLAGVMSARGSFWANLFDPIRFSQIHLFALYVCTTFFSPISIYAQTEWQKYANNPVMEKDTTLAGTWEWAAIGQPSCLFENDTFKMWYVAAGVSGVGDTIVRGRISYAHSTDGILWIKRDPPIPVLDVGAPGAWDSRWLDTPAILRDATEYKLYYCADSLDAPHSALGLATSADGIIWQKYANNPVLAKGELTGWDGFWIESPAVFYDTATGTYEMWYTGVGYGPGMPSDLWIRIGYATSPDGQNWIKDTINNPVLETGNPGSWDDAWVSVPAVRKYFNAYEMWYCGVSVADWTADSTIDTISVGYATSTNGVNWTKYSGNPVLSTYDMPIDSEGPWAPDVIYDSTEYKMWYETVGGIHLATAPLSRILEKNELVITQLLFSPNPFNSFTNLTYSVSNSACVKIVVYNSAGQRLRILVDGQKMSGAHAVQWNGEDVKGSKMPSGVYFLVFESGEYKETKKLLLLR